MTGRPLPSRKNGQGGSTRHDPGTSFASLEVETAKEKLAQVEKAKAANSERSYSRGLLSIASNGQPRTLPNGSSRRLSLDLTRRSGLPVFTPVKSEATQDKTASKSPFLNSESRQRFSAQVSLGSNGIGTAREKSRTLLDPSQGRIQHASNSLLLTNDNRIKNKTNITHGKEPLISSRAKASTAGRREVSSYTTAQRATMPTESSTARSRPRLLKSIPQNETGFPSSLSNINSISQNHSLTEKKYGQDGRPIETRPETGNTASTLARSKQSQVFSTSAGENGTSPAKTALHGLAARIVSPTDRRRRVSNIGTLSADRSRRAIGVGYSINTKLPTETVGKNGVSGTLSNHSSVDIYKRQSIVAPPIKEDIPPVPPVPSNSIGLAKDRLGTGNTATTARTTRSIETQRAMTPERRATRLRYNVNYNGPSTEPRYYSRQYSNSRIKDMDPSMMPPLKLSALQLKSVTKSTNSSPFEEQSDSIPKKSILSNVEIMNSSTITNQSSAVALPSPTLSKFPSKSSLRAALSSPSNIPISASKLSKSPTSKLSNSSLSTGNESTRSSPLLGSREQDKKSRTPSSLRQLVSRTLKKPLGHSVRPGQIGSEPDEHTFTSPPPPLPSYEGSLSPVPPPHLSNDISSSPNAVYSQITSPTKKTPSATKSSSWKNRALFSPSTVLPLANRAFSRNESLTFGQIHFSEEVIFKKDTSDEAAEDEMKRISSRRKKLDDVAHEIADLKLKHCVPTTAISALEAVKIGNLDIYEKGEILDYRVVNFYGSPGTKKIVGNMTAHSSNYGFDDEKGDYKIVVGDHLAYRYEIIGILGNGSFGQVVKCIDHKTGGLVAIKIIRNKKRFHTQALTETKILQNLNEWDPEDMHHFVRVTHNFYFRGHLCIATELLSLNLYEFVKENEFKGFSSRIVRRFTKQILSCLCLLQRKNVIHCDLKPENILLSTPSSAEIKVIDFGSSCFETERVFTYIQSRFYRSPEIILGLQYGLAIDMWSLGCIMAELYIGYPIFPGENEQEQLGCIMEVLGPPEAYMIEKASRRKLFFDSTRKPRVVISSRGRKRIPSSKTLAQALKSDDERLIDFIAQCLRWDPAKRLKPDEAVRHPFITGEPVEKHAERNRLSLASSTLQQLPRYSTARQNVARPLPEVPKLARSHESAIRNEQNGMPTEILGSKAPYSGSSRQSPLGPVKSLYGSKASASKRLSIGTASNSIIPRGLTTSVSTSVISSSLLSSSSSSSPSSSSLSSLRTAANLRSDGKVEKILERMET
ncbi:hypothetical protein V1514DRAFT_318463 [Lipomyces japonicus]|uniref:uncharacterized protein n=1 Tax=Lipomyces japonicus TaxID=56871 RepID=UPI0034CDD8C9